MKYLIVKLLWVVREVTFKDIAIKNFRFNIKKYFAYFLCSSFCITVLFMYSTLLFNDSIIKGVSPNLYNTIKSCLIIIGAFCFFFISYAHSSFIKSRSKEFGLFLTLGMTEKDINRIVNIENSTIILGALTFGLLVASVFSRLFFMIVTRILELKNINYTLSYKSYILSIGLFFLIYVAVMFIIKMYIRKLEVTELLKNSRKCVNKKVTHPMLGILGVILIGASFILTYYTILGDIFKHQPFMVVVFMCILGIGLYFIISEFGSLGIKLYKKNITIYFKRIISLNEINYKFNEYKKILYTLSILSSAAIFFIGLTFGFYMTVRDNIMKEYPYDIMYVETLSMNKLYQNKLKEVVNTKENPLNEQKKVNFTTMELQRYYDGKYELWNRNSIIFSESEINKISRKKVHVKKDNAVSCCYRKEKKAWCKKGEILKIKGEDKGKFHEFKVQEEIYENTLNYMATGKYDTLQLIILNDEDYNMMTEKSSKNVGSFNLLKFENWNNTEANLENLITALKKSNGISDNNIWNNIEKRERWDAEGIEVYRPVSKLESYKIDISKYGFLFFVISFMGLLFLISSGVVLYFKVYTDIENEKEKYKKLFKIGITDCEMKRIISKELRPTFFIPIILGSIVGIGYIAIMASNYSMYKKLLLVSIIVSLIYLMLQTSFYFITKRKYLNEILE